MTCFGFAPSTACLQKNHNNSNKSVFGPNAT